MERPRVFIAVTLVLMIMWVAAVDRCKRENEQAESEQESIIYSNEFTIPDELQDEPQEEQQLEAKEIKEEEPENTESDLVKPASYSSDSLDRYFPLGLNPLIENYLGWENVYPHGYANLLRWGKAFLQGDEGNYPPLLVDPAMKEAAIIAYNGRRWDAWLEYRRATASKYYGRGKEIVYYLYTRGRNWENCLATLEVESTFGLGGNIDFGILYPGVPNTVEGYCDLLDTWSESNDPWEQACFWNMPGYPRYQRGFVKVVETMKNFWP